MSKIFFLIILKSSSFTLSKNIFTVESPFVVRTIHDSEVLIENFKILHMILDIVSESLSSHNKCESYNADNNSKDLITFCKCEGEKIYKNYFCKIHFLHFEKIYL